MPTDTIELNALLGPPAGSSLEALIVRLRELDSDLWLHAAWVARAADIVASRIELNATDRGAMVDAAWLHDIGKLTIPWRILDKPGPLDEIEWIEMRTHAARGADYLTQDARYRGVAPLVRHHHERFDGCGYPDGLSRLEIPLGARIICVVDAYDAMRTDRPYRYAMSADSALDELDRCAGTQFDPAIVAAFATIAPDLEDRLPR